MIQKILSAGNPILQNISLPIEDVSSDKTHIYAKNLIDTLTSVPGVGLALPQIGVNKKMFCIWIRQTKKSPHLIDTGPQIFINPNITRYSEQQVSLLEGCLSIPGPSFEHQVFAQVVRSSEIDVNYYDINGTCIQTTLTDIQARVFLHEYDHLDGILFPEKVSDRKTLITGSEILRSS